MTFHVAVDLSSTSATSPSAAIDITL